MNAETWREPEYVLESFIQITYFDSMVINGAGVTKELLKHDLDPDDKGRYGRTPLSYASEIKVAKILLKMRRLILIWRIMKDRHLCSSQFATAR